MTSLYAFQVSTRILTGKRTGLFLSDSTLGGGFRKVCFREPDPPDPSGRLAKTPYVTQTYVVSQKTVFLVDGALYNTVKAQKQKHDSTFLHKVGLFIKYISIF